MKTLTFVLLSFNPLKDVITRMYFDTQYISEEFTEAMLQNSGTMGIRSAAGMPWEAVQTVSELTNKCLQCVSIQVSTKILDKYKCVYYDTSTNPCEE